MPEQIKRMPFQEWYKTVPEDKKDTMNYRLRYAYENDLIPQDQLDEFVNNKDAHLMSAYYNKKTGNYDFIKSKNHPTFHMEIDWYKSKDAAQFRREYEYKEDDSDFPSYTRRAKYGNIVEPLENDKTSVARRRYEERVPRYNKGTASFTDAGNPNEGLDITKLKDGPLSKEDSKRLSEMTPGMEPNDRLANVIDLRMDSVKKAEPLVFKNSYFDNSQNDGLLKGGSIIIPRDFDEKELPNYDRKDISFKDGDSYEDAVKLFDDDLDGFKSNYSEKNYSAGTIIENKRNNYEEELLNYADNLARVYGKDKDKLSRKAKIKLLKKEGIDFEGAISKNIYELSDLYASASDPIVADMLEYKNSDMFIERTVASQLASEGKLDLDKFLSDKDYRRSIVNEHISNPENLELLKRKMYTDKKSIGLMHRDASLMEASASSDGAIRMSALASVKPGDDLLSDDEEVAFKRFIELAEKDEETTAAINRQIKYSGESFEDGARSVFGFFRGLNAFVTQDPSDVYAHEVAHLAFDKRHIKSDEADISKIYPENTVISKNNLMHREPDMSRIVSDRDKERVSRGYVVPGEINHDESPEETKADIASVRSYLRKKGIHNHREDIFGDKEFDALMNDKQFMSTLIGERMLSRFGQDRKKWKLLMNVIASRNGENNNNFA